eukprot:Gb_25305 [translate_table: standard]
MPPCTKLDTSIASMFVHSPFLPIRPILTTTNDLVIIVKPRQPLRESTPYIKPGEDEPTIPLEVYATDLKIANDQLMLENLEFKKKVDPEEKFKRINVGIQIALN